MKYGVLFFGLLVLAACSAATDEASVSKASLAQMGGKADSSAVAALCEAIYGEPCDLCERQGWYGDDICDAFCQQPDPDCGADACTYDGVVYSDGDSFLATDGCNNCGCSDGLVACTELACAPNRASCFYNGKEFQDGEGFPSVDGCNGCGCNDGLVVCTEIACAPEPGSCVVDGVTYANGASDVPDPDSCNTCSCVDGQVTNCTEIHCPNPPPGQTCAYYGKEYQDGEGFAAADGCNHCGCNQGSVYCTELWCGEPDVGTACADKLCGEECAPECPEDDPNCVLPQVIHLCSADGACLPSGVSCN